MFLKNKYRKLTDNELLLELKKSNNRRIITEIYKRYSYLIFGVCLKFNNNKSNCKDLVSKVFEKFIIFIGNNEIKSLNAWFYTVAKNECFAENKNKIKFNSLNEYEFYDEKNVGFNDAINVSDKIIYESINELKNEQQICITLFYLQDKSYKQISQETGFEIKKIKSYIQNGKRNLKIIIDSKMQKNQTK